MNGNAGGGGGDDDSHCKNAADGKRSIMMCVCVFVSFFILQTKFCL